MKKLIFTIALATLFSCSKEELPIEETQATYCGNVYFLQSEYSGATFVGIRYGIILDAPVTIGATTYTRANFTLNDALNTQSTEQYTINDYVCSSSAILIP